MQWEGWGESAHETQGHTVQGQENFMLTVSMPGPYGRVGLPAKNLPHGS